MERMVSSGMSGLNQRRIGPMMREVFWVEPALVDIPKMMNIQTKTGSQ